MFTVNVIDVFNEHVSILTTIRLLTESRQMNKTLNEDIRSFVRNERQAPFGPLVSTCQSEYLGHLHDVTPSATLVGRYENKCNSVEVSIHQVDSIRSIGKQLVVLACDRHSSSTSTFESTLLNGTNSISDHSCSTIYYRMKFSLDSFVVICARDKSEKRLSSIDKR
jgi:hypothetical protein